jgi:hypothetical protein
MSPEDSSQTRIPKSALNQVKQDEMRREYVTNLGQIWRIHGLRGYMMEMRGGKKERPEGGQEERGGAPHGKPFGGGINGEKKGQAVGGGTL